MRVSVILTILFPCSFEQNHSEIKKKSKKNHLMFCDGEFYQSFLLLFFLTVLMQSDSSSIMGMGGSG